MTDEPSPERWQRLEALFFEALDLEPAARPAFLDQACSGDAVLRREVEALLNSSDKTLDDLRRPVDEAARQVVSDGGGPATRRVGPYRVVRLLGEGGMGLVYLAERADEQYRQRVAVKLMHAGFGRDPEMLRRFRAERQILANLDHPNIAHLLDGGITPEGSPYLVMEYVDGVPIDAFCRDHALPASARLQLVRTVCAAVEYAHRNLVVHRDIKPANILVTADGMPKLLDFGIAKLLDPDKVTGTFALTRGTERLMTPEYASPEQVRGEPVTTATDVYALGVLLYELLTGRPPFKLETKSPLEVARVICEQEPVRPSTASRSNPSTAPLEARRLRGDLDNIVLKAMRKEPARRYPSVGQLSEDVRRFLEGYPVEARGDAWRYRAGKFIGRHKAGVVAAVSMALAIVGFGIGMGILARRATRERTTAQREAQFLASIYQASTPEQARGHPVTTRDLLDQGAKRINVELADEPEIQAAMLDNVGQAYAQLGVYDKAEPLLRQAYELRRQILGDNHPDVAASLDSLGTVIRLQGRYAEAEPFFRRALAIRQQALGPQNENTAITMANLGECLFLEDKYTEPETLLRKALAIERQLNSPSGSGCRNYLALVLQARGDYGEAAELLREAVEIDRRMQGADSPAFANSLHNLAGAEMRTGDLLGAETAEREDLALRRKILGNDHPDLGYPLNNLGWILLQKGELKEAEALLGENLSLERRHFGDKNPKTVPAFDNWARVLQAKGEYPEAEDYYKKSLALVEPTPGAQNWSAAQILANLGVLQLDRGNYAAAERYVRQALEMRRKLGGNDNPDVATSLIDVGVARTFQHDPASAEPLMRQALEIRRKTLQAGHPDIIAAEVRLGSVLTAEGKAQEAEPLLQEAVNSARNAPFPLLGWQVAEAESALGDCLAALGRRSEAEPLLRESAAALKTDPEAALRRQALALAAKVESAPRQAANNPPSMSQ